MNRLQIAVTIVLFLELSSASVAFNFDSLAKDVMKGAKGAVDMIPLGKISESNSASSTDTGKISFDALTTMFEGFDSEEERAIGREISGRLLGASPLVKDKKLQKYVNKVGVWVALQSERPDLKWTFGVIESDDINAFASPGGYIFLTKGLYLKLNNEAELAGVLGHEIGHVIKKHHLNILKQSKLIDSGSKIAASQMKNNNKLMDNLLGNGAEILARGLDKKAEYEADRIGVILSARAGYNAYGLPIVLQEIGHSSGSSVDLLFKTHPHPNKRIKNLDVAMGEFSDKGLYIEERFYRLSK